MSHFPFMLTFGVKDQMVSKAINLTVFQRCIKLQICSS